MAGLKPKSSGKGGNGGNYEQRNFPVPKSGARRARLSLIVDLGTQEREPSYIGPDGKLCKPDADGAVRKDNKPAHQIAMFADLVNDVVDYGGEIGKAQYRLLLNKSFKGDIQGINFYHCPPIDNKGNIIEGKKWSYHAQSMLTKLGDAIGIENFGVQDENDDVELLLNGQFIAEVDVKETNSGKQDKDGNDIIYKNVNFKKPAKVPPEMKEDEDGNEVEVVPTFAKLQQPAMIIGFDNVDEDNVKFLRADIRKKIKLSAEYDTPEGAQMKAAIEAYEAKLGIKDDGDTKADKPAAKPKAAPAKPKKPVAQDFSDMDSDIPF
jgi:hypothetical protein